MFDRLGTTLYLVCFVYMMLFLLFFSSRLKTRFFQWILIVYSALGYTHTLVKREHKNSFNVLLGK